MLISIIIPVYNAEKFLRKCLDSIRKQTYKNIEIILVNDGSTDRSGLICDEYSKIDNRFIVIHKENGGVSSARNCALKVINGAYIGFVDPDDWVELCMFENLYNLVKNYNCEIGICGYIKEDINGKVLDNTIQNNITSSNIIRLSSIEALNLILEPNGFKGFLWNKLFSTKLLKEENILFFDENIHFCEDLLFGCQCILKSKNLVYDMKPYYHYVIHDNNICNSSYSNKKLTSLDALEKIINLLSYKQNIDIYKYKNLYMHINISLLMNSLQERKCTKQIYNKLKKNLYRYSIFDFTDKMIKVSCIGTRVNIKLFYSIWKFIK